MIPRPGVNRWHTIILGEPASKANSRRLFTNKYTGKRIIIKSAKALSYVDDFLIQCPRVQEPMTGDIVMTAHVFYASRRPDLDVSIIMDCLQKARVIGNDRQIIEQHLRKFIDPANPRCEIWLEPIPEERT